jgi:hypothetical protein
MRFIGYQAAECYCRRLASQLHAHLGPELGESRFVAIPRGGLIVLGMLSYILRLERAQVEGWGSTAANLVVVVDDCSLSGRRFAMALERLDAPRVVFAHLFSHPQLRQAILDSEPRVEACLAAEDLHERTDFAPGDAEAFWAQWRERLPGRRYWLGAVEPIAFAWSEPDKVLWNERTQRLEDNWHRVSPRYCLDTWGALGIPLMEAPPGSLDVPPHVCWKIDGDEVILWHSQVDQVYGLQGVAGAMWRALVAYGDADAVVKYLLSRYDVDGGKLRSDLIAFVNELLGKGLLERVNEPGDNEP